MQSVLQKVSAPTLLLDERKCLDNITKMIQKSRLARVGFRPHFKTHVSAAIGQQFKKLGVDSICVSSLKMAEYFSGNGWTDILLAFPVNIREISALNKLASRVKLGLLVEQRSVFQDLDRHMSAAYNCFIKVDLSYGRTGVSWHDNEKLLDLAKCLHDSSLANFAGTISHAGHSYQCRSEAEISEIHRSSLEQLASVKNLLSPIYPELTYSVGDTPTCSTMSHFSPATEIRPGNFVFYDLTQVEIGSCVEEEVAVVMACPVVALHEDRSELIIHGGKVHFAQDSVYHRRIDKQVYGMVVQSESEQWSASGKSYLKKLSQEHGTVHLADEDIGKYQVGDLILILPVHSCTCANLMGEYLTLNGKLIKRMG